MKKFCPINLVSGFPRSLEYYRDTNTPQSTHKYQFDCSIGQPLVGKKGHNLVKVSRFKMTLSLEFYIPLFLGYFKGANQSQNTKYQKCSRCNHAPVLEVIRWYLERKKVKGVDL